MLIWIIIYIFGILVSMGLFEYYEPEDHGAADDVAMGMVACLWPLALLFGVPILVARTLKARGKKMTSSPDYKAEQIKGRDDV